MTLEVLVDYTVPIEAMIAAGHYDWFNQGINEINFPIPQCYRARGQISVGVTLLDHENTVPKGKTISYGQVSRNIKARKKRPGILPELLWLGAAFPSLQLEFPIVQIGTLWATRGGRRGLYLRRGNKERGLAAIWMGHGFLPYYRFIAVED